MNSIKSRIAWIDWAKAFAIFLVVFGHIEVYSLGQYSGFFHRLQAMFCMPLFFFLSGMFAKPHLHLSDSYNCVISKFLQLMVPFLVCGSFFVFLMSGSPWWSLFWYPKGEVHMGYWFILVLFEIYCLFALCQVISRTILKASTTGIMFLSVAGAIWGALLIIMVMGYAGFIPQEPWWTVVSYGRIYYNFPFFILGFWLKNNPKIMNLVLSQKVYIATSLSFLILYIAYDKYNIQSFSFKWLLALLAMLVVLHIFNEMGRMSNTLVSATGVGKFLDVVGYVGRHTLDIYVLHFFFLPQNMLYLRKVIAPDACTDINIVLELVINSSLAMIVISVSLACSYIIMKNPIMSRLLLGKSK